MFDTPEEADDFVLAIANNWQEAPLRGPDRALCEFARKLTHHQHDVGPDDLDALRTQGFDDTAIHDATQVVAYFNYITRIADGLGVEVEPFTEKWEQQ